jgi:hypothetical protein
LGHFRDLVRVIRGVRHVPVRQSKADWLNPEAVGRCKRIRRRRQEKDRDARDRPASVGERLVGDFDQVSTARQRCASHTIAKHTLERGEVLLERSHLGSEGCRRHGLEVSNAVAVAWIDRDGLVVRDFAIRRVTRHFEKELVGRIQISEQFNSRYCSDGQ